MGTFELDHNREPETAAAAEVVGTDTRRIKQECIIALKVYDQCRQLYCKIHTPY